LRGNLVGNAKITRDLTERKKAENTLQASEQKFHLLVQSVTDYAIYMLDPRGFVANWNSGAQRIKGYAAEEIIGQHFSLNERDAMPDGGFIVIDAALGPQDGFVCLSVTDQGTGMDEATLQKATDPFFTTKGVGKGTGLGLSMVRGLAEQSGGTFRLGANRHSIC
jgi:nitrogen fixation/metabolism regulation signal transduction histidine kinase